MGFMGQSPIAASVLIAVSALQDEKWKFWVDEVSAVAHTSDPVHSPPHPDLWRDFLEFSFSRCSSLIACL